MTEPLQRPPRKNPIKRTQLPTRPPAARSRTALGLTAAAAVGRFRMQVCDECAAVQYPPREVCHRCLGDALRWKDVSPNGLLISETTLTHSNDLYFRERLPLRTGIVKMDAGPVLVAHLHGDLRPASRTRLALRLDRSGQAVIMALPETDTPHMEDDRMTRAFGNDPKFRRALVTDGRTTLGQAMIRALLDAGASRVFVGRSEPWKPCAALDALARLPEVEVVALDVTDSVSVRDCAASYGAKVDILINTARHQRSGGILSAPGGETARDEMEVNYFGLLRLAQAFGPVMNFRAADGVNTACAWVNLLSVNAVAPHPSAGTYCASQAAAFALSKTLRAEFAPTGLRLVNVLTGPIEEEWEQLTPPPKLSPANVAGAVIKALRDGVEESYVGDVAQELLDLMLDNPKGLERKMAE